MLDKFDIESLTLGEISTIERMSGAAIGSIADDDMPKGLALTAIVYVIGRRQRDGFTMKDAENTSMKDALALIGDDEDPKASEQDSPSTPPDLTGSEPTG